MTSTENTFFGKSPILNLLKRRVLDLKEGYRQNVALLGGRFVGKSLLLRTFIGELDAEDMIVIYLDLDNKDFNYFFSRFVGSLLYNFSRTQKLPLFDDLPLLLENAKALIPQTVEEIKRIQGQLSEDRCKEAYCALISLPELFSSETGKFCVVILDEFQNLEELGMADVFQELGKKIMTQKRSIYIVSSSAAGFAKKILSEKLSLLFGNFEIIEMEPLDLSHSANFIDHRLPGIRMSPALSGFLTDFTAGHPLYLDLITQEIVHLCAVHKQPEVFIPLLIQAIENVLFNPWGALSRHFDILITQLAFAKNQRAMSSVLIALANGKHKLKEVAQQVGLKGSVLNQRISRLIESSIILKNGSAFHFQDKLLRYWIKYVFQKRLQAIDLEPTKNKKEFVEEVSRSWANFQKVCEKDLSSRIVELFACFDNEAFSLNGRKYKLPAFYEIAPLNSHLAGADVQIIKASESQGDWFIILKRNSLSENDVNAFVAELKKLNQKPQRRVIISLTDLDENARLKALQERMWIWNEKEINALLGFYDKPFILK